jgi:hypothetical protein
VKDVIGSILPLAIAVTISPIPIIAEILLLFTKKPVADAASYLAGFILGVAGVLAILVAIAGTINLSAGSGPSKGASILQLALGALLLAASLRQFRGRPKPGQEAAMPKWMNGIAGFAPGKSLLVGVGIGALNPKNIIVGVAAAVAIACQLGRMWGPARCTYSSPCSASPPRSWSRSRWARRPSRSWTAGRPGWARTTRP